MQAKKRQGTIGNCCKCFDILLHCIVKKFQESGYEIHYELDYELDYEKEIRFSMNLNFLDAHVLTGFQEQAEELMDILKVNVLPSSDTSAIRKINVKEYMKYPGKRKPYYATIFIDKYTKVDLLHVHYYQSSDSSGQSVFEPNDTVYYDVFWVFENTHWDKNVFPSGISVTLQSDNQKPKKFMSYYKYLKANQDSTDK